uniref:Uncharacterized protein n=1 Tax=Oryza glumipatula TaxID=40148 RepID=A0A0E0AUS3_9ORYZ
MEGALVSTATGALKPILAKLAALLGDKYTIFKGLHKEIKSLSTELMAIHAFLLNMSEEENPDAQDQAWMTEVRELSYDMEDIIDEFMVHVDDESATPDGFISKCKKSLANMKTKRRIAKAIEDFKSQINIVGERHARYRSEKTICRTSNTIIDHRALSIFEHASNLVGIEGPKNEVIKLLSDDDGCESKQQHPKVVSVVGFGGLGKTTLAYQVYQQLKGNFSCSVFVSVSRNPDMMRILRTILSEVTQRDYAVTEAGDEQQLIIKISNFLSKKRYFVVIDDIWNVEIWNIIKGAFSMNSRCSKIITTTRISDVARSCCSSFRGHLYNIRPLDTVHSRTLFHRRLFNPQEKCPSHLEEVSDQILKKCDGLPLAIIAISGLLANKLRTKDQWEHVKNSIGCALERNPTVEGMIKDYVIRKNDLILRWIAEGFIHKEDSNTLYESGEMCFNELVNRNLLQLEKQNYNGCRVHDTVLDFIISMSKKNNFVTLVTSPCLTIEGQNKIRRLSLQVGSEEGNSIQRTMLSHARSLDVFWLHLQEIPSLVEFRHLRVQSQHLANIGKLFQLRFLNLRKTGLNELPEEIGFLQNLQALNLEGSNMHRLPPHITRLGNLVHLFTDIRIQLPEGIAKMRSLETLKWVDLSNHSSNINLRELKLFMPNDDICDEHVKVIASCLVELGRHNLRRLYIVGYTELPNSLLPDPWCPSPLKLEELDISDSPMVQVPSWMRSFVQLKRLGLILKDVSDEDLTTLGRLPSLLHLHLNIPRGEPGYEDRLLISGCHGFSCLRQFYLTGQQPIFTAGSMPRLELLRVEMDESKPEFLTNASLENLPCLTTVKCLLFNFQRGEVAQNGKTAMARAMSSHPNHPSLVYE